MEFTAELEETTEIVAGGNVIAQMISGETDVQIATAKRYPRDLAKVAESVRKQVTSDPETAKAMTYAKPGKDEKGNDCFYNGASVRFAEVVSRAWGNMRCGARIIEVGDRYVTAQGMAWDLESNFAQSRERKASITKRNGNRYGESMVATAANAAAAIAYREAILKTIPKYFWEPLWKAAQQSLVGTPEKAKKERDSALNWFEKNGVSVGSILAKLGKPSVDAITPEDVLSLHAIYSSVKQGETTLAQQFAPVAETNGTNGNGHAEGSGEDKFAKAKAEAQAKLEETKRAIATAQQEIAEEKKAVEERKTPAEPESPAPSEADDEIPNFNV